MILRIFGSEYIQQIVQKYNVTIVGYIFSFPCKVKDYGPIYRNAEYR